MTAVLIALALGVALADAVRLAARWRRRHGRR